MTMQLKTYYKMCKHCGNDEGCDAAMDAMHDLLNQSSVLPIAMAQTTGDDNVEQENSKYFLNVNQIMLLLFLVLHICSFRSYSSS